MKPIAQDSLHINNFKEYFAEKSKISSKEIHNFYRKIEEDIKSSTIRWRIYELKNKKIIHHIKRGWYSLDKPDLYIPDISDRIKKIYHKVNDQFPYLDSCIWSTKWLNEFMIFQPGRFYTIYEIEKGGQEAAFEFLKDNNYEVFISPSSELLNRYTSEINDTIIVKNLVTESPLQKIKSINTVTIEKMLVDVFSDKKIFSAYHGKTLLNIFETAFKRYSVDESRLLRYASRKNKKEEMKIFINSLIQ